jgi:hypothetical protein
VTRNASHVMVRNACFAPLCLPGFSGSDVFVHVMEGLAREWQRRYNKKVTIRSVYACEKGTVQQAFLQRNFPDTQYLFPTVESSSPWKLLARSTVPCAWGQVRRNSDPIWPWGQVCRSTEPSYVLASSSSRGQVCRNSESSEQ